MNCPDTQHELEEVTRHGVTIDQCVYCGGAWFDAGEFDAIRQHKDSLGRQPPEAELIEEPEHGNRSCPRCGTSTLGLGFLGAERIDRCTSCRGIWVPGPKDIPGGPARGDAELDAALVALDLVIWIPISLTG